MREATAKAKTKSANKTITIAECIKSVQAKFLFAKLYFGHGTDNAYDEAVYLIFYALQLPFASYKEVLQREITAKQQQQIDVLVTRRIKERKPTAYLTNEAWFAGLPFYVDERVLIPRSPLAELIEQHFQPWIARKKVRRILDIGTGSGCIAIACAYAFPQAQIDAVDVSRAALRVAQRNIRKHRVQDRVTLFLSDVFSNIKNKKYDVIISNPPYVMTKEFSALPKEYKHEPKLALAAGKQGLAIVDKILKSADKFLASSGILVVEVGNAAPNLVLRYPRMNFVWLDFAVGESEVFLLLKNKTGSQLTAR